MPGDLTLLELPYSFIHFIITRFKEGILFLSPFSPNSVAVELPVLQNI